MRISQSDSVNERLKQCEDLKQNCSRSRITTRNNKEAR